MTVKPKFYFYEEDTNNFLHLNERYQYIWEEFDSEAEAIASLNRLVEELSDLFGYVELELEVRKKYVYQTPR